MLNMTDVTFIIVCAAMILLMTPALAVFYAGLTRKHSGVDIMMQVWICVAVVGILWMMFGFTLAFGADSLGGIFGDGEYLFLKNVGIEVNEAGGATIPFIVFFLLQVTYAIITPALICGAVVERMTLKSYIVFVVVWSTIVYIPFVHMIWGGGFMSAHGMMDWAGGLVIHTSAGFSALAAALVLGKRRNLDNTPSNTSQISLNVGILLFGWLAFNGASALKCDESAIWAIVNSLVGAFGGMAIWAVLTALREKRPSFLNCMLGLLAGLVAVTPAAGYITNPMKALLMSIIVSVVCYISMFILRPIFGFDDSLDVWGLHGMGGLTGTILLPLFVDPNLAGITNVGKQVGIQAMFTLGGAAYAFFVTFFVLKLINIKIAIRRDERTEINVDERLYQERMYEFD